MRKQQCNCNVRRTFGDFLLGLFVVYHCLCVLTERRNSVGFRVSNSDIAGNAWAQSEAWRCFALLVLEENVEPTPLCSNGKTKVS